MLSNVKPVVLDVILSSTCHGIPNIFKSTKSALKFLWIFCSILSTAGCCLLVFQNIAKYLKYEVTTKIRVKNDYIATFPAITICNINFFTTEKATELLPFCSEILTPSSLDDYDFQIKFRNCLEKHGLMEQNKSIYGDSKKKLINGSWFKNELLNLKEFVYFYHSEYGNCYTFNSGVLQNGSHVDLKKMARSRRTDGLILILNFEIDKGLLEYPSELGGIIFIHNQESSPYSVTGVLIGTKSTANIGLKRTFAKSEPKPYSECDGNTKNPESHESELYKLILAKNGYYTQAFCIEQCYQKKLSQTCNCTEFMIPSVFDKEPCDLYGKCYQHIMGNFFTFENINKECIDLCPLECEKQTFDQTISAQTLNGTDHYSVVYIYYDSLASTVVEESPTTTPADLISSIGGVAGLFLGMSLLSLVEIIEVVFRLIFILFDRQIFTQRNSSVLNTI
ncbi:acid-sensing ion channel 5 [Brachionus plicatilis]|uniref:Acid-sensing ion channel 5 n=1 Tax=Brachionus plicatilis TaxID=10195 RepID=A0A3M7P1L2_BRAPC|nr:acid-sensing ion channel 5 [Brachionus plicatilis]